MKTYCTNTLRGSALKKREPKCSFERERYIKRWIFRINAAKRRGFGNTDVMDKNDCVLPRGILRFATDHYQQPIVLGGEMCRNAINTLMFATGESNFEEKRLNASNCLSRALQQM